MRHTDYSTLLVLCSRCTLLCGCGRNRNALLSGSISRNLRTGSCLCVLTDSRSTVVVVTIDDHYTRVVVCISTDGISIEDRTGVACSTDAVVGSCHTATSGSIGASGAGTD